MSPDTIIPLQQTAVRDFDRARKQAAMHQFFARVRGRSDDLLSYADVHDQLGVTGVIERGVQEIPLKSIVGSVGRYQDFTRDFLPKRDSDEERWVGVKTAVDQMVGMPPIEVYQINDAYFVKDGNHRVSIARQLGVDTITAYVTQVETRVPLSVDDDPAVVIRKARFRRFLEETNIDKLRPDSDLTMTFVGQYQILIDQIDAHRRIVEQDDHVITDDEAVMAWYDDVYMPIIRLIREQGVLHNFPKRTEADIYIFLYDHCEELEATLGWDVDRETAVEDLVDKKKRSKRSIRRAWHALTPRNLEEGPEPGKWRKKQLAKHRGGHLFADILIALTGEASDEALLERIIAFAKPDNDRLLGLHIVKKKSLLGGKRVKRIKDLFELRCKEAGLVGKFAVEVGNVATVIVKRAAWADLVVVGMTHPPGGRSLASLGHGLNTLVQSCPRPILVIPTKTEVNVKSPILLSYDGSRKADEALFLAAYFAFRQSRKLTVVTVKTDRTDRSDLAYAQKYLEERQIEAEYVFQEDRSQSIAKSVLETAVSTDAGLLIMGGFGFRSVMHLVLGSAVDEILREFKRPVLICR